MPGSASHDASTVDDRIRRAARAAIHPSRRPGIHRRGRRQCSRRRRLQAGRADSWIAAPGCGTCPAGQPPRSRLRPPPGARRHLAAPAGRPDDGARRSVGLWQEHAAAPVRRPARCQDRRDRQRLRPHGDPVPAAAPAALEDHARQHRPGPEGPRHAGARARGASPSHGPRTRTGRHGTGPVSAPALRRHAEPGRAGTRTGAGTRPAAAGRALCRAGHRPAGPDAPAAADATAAAPAERADDHP